MSTASKAIALAARGFYVFPIKEGAKHPPLWKNWPGRATINPAEIDKWPSTANIGIHCAGLVVLDVDVRSGGDASLATLDLEYGLPPTLTTRTPTGGRHLFYRLPDGHPGVSNGANKLGPGIDVKSTNGYVVAPGSEVPAGRYRFEADVPTADAPEWLVPKLGTVVPKTATSTNCEQAQIVDASLEVLERARDWLGKRAVGGGASYVTACGLRDFGLSLAQARDLFAAHDSRTDALAQVDHAYRYAQNAPGSKAARAEDFPVLDSPAQPPRPRRKMLRLDELAKQPASTSYLVKGLLQRGSHAVVFGQPGAGKTFVALDIAYHVAGGLPWQGLRVHQGPVLYLAYEGLGGMAKRAAALARRYEDADVPLYLVGADYNLRDPAGRRALGEDMAQMPEKPVLVVIDTLARAMKGGDENSAQDMGALNDAVSALIHATGACVMLVHHSGKNKASGARGSSALLGAIDTEIEVDARQLTSRKQRDVELAPPMGFKLVPVVIGMDGDGDEVLSCYVEPCVPVAERTAGLRGSTQLVWDALCGTEDNEPISSEVWQGRCAEFLPKTDAARRSAFYKAKQALIKRGLIEQLPDGKYQRRLE